MTSSRLTLLACFALAVLGCSRALQPQDDILVATDPSGAVHVPLVTSDAQGRHYRLQGAALELSGAAMATLSEPQGGRRDRLMMPLPPGSYSIYLRPGFQVVEVLADGSEHPVAARLSPRNPSHLHVAPQQNVEIELTFRVDDGELTFGRAPVQLSQATSAHDHAPL